MTASVAVVLPVRNRPAVRVLRAGETIRRSCGDLEINLIVSDYGSDNGHDLKLVADELGADYIRTEADHWNKPHCLNKAISTATSEYVLCADIDILWHPSALRQGLERLENPDGIVRVLAFQSRDLPSNLTEELLATSSYDFDFLEKSASLHSTWGNGILLFRRSSWHEVGGYDERLSVYGVEDVDFCRRLQFAGAKFVWSDPSSSRIYHVWHPRLDRTSPKGAFNRALERNKNIWRGDFSVVRNAVGEGVDSSPLVSVVIATSGRQALLEEALCSILCQTVQNFEVIVVDDGQVDDSESVVASFDDKRFVYVGLSERRGISYARNIGTKRARGQFIAVMDDDDICLPDRFSTSLASITRGVDGCVGSFITFYESDGRVVSWDDPAPTVEGAFAIGGFAGHPTWMIRRSVFEQFSYDESFSSAVDNNRALRMLNSGVQLVHSGEPHILRRVHEGQVSNKDQQFQGFGALLDKTWLWSGYARSEYNSLKSRSEESRPRNAPVLYESRFLPYLPDDLVSRQIDVDVWNRSDFEFCKSLEVAGPWFALESEDGEFVYGKIRVEGTWRNMARVSQRRLRFAIVCFEPKPTLSAKDYVKQEQEFSPAVPWDEIGWRDDLERLKMNTSGDVTNPVNVEVSVSEAGITRCALSFEGKDGLCTRV